MIGLGGCIAVTRIIFAVVKVILISAGKGDADCSVFIDILLHRIYIGSRKYIRTLDMILIHQILALRSKFCIIFCSIFMSDVIFIYGT